MTHDINPHLGLTVGNARHVTDASSAEPQAKQLRVRFGCLRHLCCITRSNLTRQYQESYDSI